MANINDWLSIDKASGTGNAYITLTASSSNELQERIASLSVKTRSKEVFLNVKQLAFNNYFVLGKNLISPLWEGGSYSNFALSNISWTYTSSDWLSLSVTSGSVGKTEFNVVVQPNTSEETRIGFVNIVASNGAIMGTIKVAQASHNEVNNIIFYTSTDGNKITPSNSGYVANEYVDGVGALYFANTITSVPLSLFLDSKTLASVSVPETVTTIDTQAFYGCRNLASYDFPDALTTIGKEAFYDCRSLTIFDFPYVETIRDNAFNGCSSFETVILSDTLKTLGDGAFQYCTKLKTIHIGSGLTSIPKVLCQKCTSLKTVNIPTNIKRIEEGAFNDCRAIETLDLHGGIEYIGYRAFDWNELKSVTLGERTSALEEGGECFTPHTASMTDAYVTDIKSWFLWKPSIFTNDNIVRNLYVNGELLTEVVTPTDYNTVPEFAFYKNPHITRVVVTDNVTSVEGGAFNGLNNANYLYLGSRASYNNNNTGSYSNYNVFTDFDGTLETKNTDGSVLSKNYFTKVVFMGQTTKIPSSDSTQEIEFRGDVVSVDTSNDNVFKNVTRVVVNCNRLNIGNKLFRGAILLTDFDFSKVTSIGEYAFVDTSITEITNAPLLTSIGQYAFSNLKLKTVDLSNSPLTSIGQYAFKNCNVLTEMTLPSLSYAIGRYAFYDCYKLKHIKMVAEEIKTEEREIARLSNAVYNTGIDATVNSRLEFDYKYTQSQSGDGYYEIIGAGNTDDDNVFQIRIQNNVFHFHIGTSQFGVKGITPNVFHHFVVSLDEGIIVDDVLKKTLTRSNKTINAPFYINGIQYAPARHANGEFGTIKIDDTVITPKEDGFYNGSTKLDVVKSGEYEYRKEIVILNPPAVPQIDTSTFDGVASYGFLEYPLELDYSTWLSTKQYYLGYYKWNRFKLSANELDFDAADTYEVTVNNGIPKTWEITKLPFWLSASVMSGGEGTTTITFTKTVDYVETDDIIFSIMGVNYVIKAKYTVRTLDFTQQDTYVLNISNTTSITDVEWLTETFDTEAVTLALSTIYTVESATIIITSSIGSFKVNVIADGTNTPLPNDNNRIYYTGSIDITNSVKYGTNADYVGTGYYGRGLYYIEYDRPILWITQQFGEGSNIKTLGLPSSLQYIDNDCFKDCSSLKSVSFGGTEKYIGDNVFYNCSLLSNYTLPSTIYYYGNNCFYNTSNENLIFGAETEYIGGGAFSNTSINKTIKFLGTIPPSVQSSTLQNSTIYAPIGSDYSSLGVTIEYTLEGQERNRGAESYWLDGNQINLFNPETIAKILYYDGETKQYTMVNLGTTPKNTSDKYISLSYTKNNLTTNYEVRNISAYCLIEAISDSYNYSGPTIIFNIKVTMKNIDYVEFWEASRDELSSVPRCNLGLRGLGYGASQSGEYNVGLSAMGALPPTSCITVKYTDKMGRETYSQYNFIEIDYRVVAGSKPSTTKYYVEGYVTHK